MPYKILPPQDLLNHLFSYDPNSGVLTWVNPRSKRVKPGNRAGSLTNQGYINVKVDGKNYRAHRIIWMMQYGFDPIELDHLNRARSDNRLVNLREVTRAENTRNRSTRSDNTSGVQGVYHNKDGRPKPWMAFINNNDGKLISKYFATEAEAISQRNVWKLKFNYL